MAILQSPKRPSPSAGKVTITVEFVTDISFWNALKLRLAGGEVVKQFIESQMRKTEEKCNNKGFLRDEILEVIVDDLTKSGPLYSEMKKGFGL